MKLSIIIPYHDSLEYLEELLDVLIPQLNDDCELIIVDDDVDTYELYMYEQYNVRVINHDNNSGRSKQTT